MTPAQLRAILRAGAGAQVSIMFPMVSSLEEFLEARDILFSCRDELALEGTPHIHGPRVGIMIEIPSAVLAADALARRKAQSILETGAQAVVTSWEMDRPDARILAFRAAMSGSLTSG